MRAEQSTDWMCPVADLYEITSNGAHGAPQVVFARESVETLDRTNTPDLVVVSGPLSAPSAHVQALRLAARQAERVLTIAVLHLPHGERAAATEHTQLQELFQAFDSVFVVNKGDAADLVCRLIRAIISPGSPGQPIGCDWNDVRSIVGGASDALPGSYGFACGAGAGRATSAAMAAIAQLARQGFRLHQARGLCIAITAAPSKLLGSEVKEVMGHFRIRVNASTSIVQCIAYDDTLDDGVMEVDVFAFGALDAIGEDIDASKNEDRF